MIDYWLEPRAGFLRLGRAVILTALPLEYDAVRAHLEQLSEDDHPPNIVYEKGYFVGTGWYWEVGIAKIGQGNPNAASHAQQAVDFYRPDVILFVGVAGGIKDVALGDVVAADEIFAYESTKEASASDEALSLPRVHAARSSRRLVARAYAESGKSDWLKLLGASEPDAQVRALVGPVVAGEKVVAATVGHAYDSIRRNFSHALAVEMEGYGFLQGVFDTTETQAIVVRGISDLLADKQLSDEGRSQPIAAKHAAAFAFQILKSLETELIRHPNEYLSAINNILVSYNQLVERQAEQFAFFASRTDRTISDQINFTNGYALDLEFVSDKLSDELHGLHRAIRVQIAQDQHTLANIQLPEEELTTWLLDMRNSFVTRQSAWTALIRQLDLWKQRTRQQTFPNEYLHPYGDEVIRVLTGIAGQYAVLENHAARMIVLIDQRLSGGTAS